MIAARSACIALILLSISPHCLAMPVADGPRRVQWHNIPIRVVLSIGNERRVQFPAPVSVGVPASLQSALRVQTVNGTIYLKPRVPFTERRILVRELDSGQTYLLDLEATEGEVPNEAIVIEAVVRPDTPLPQVASGARTPPGYVALTRFAAQQLFAPLRLASALPGVARVPVQTQDVRLFADPEIAAQPLMAWRAGNLFLTAVRLQNQGRKAKLLDPRRLHGDWLAATLQHARLLPAGHVADSTAVYLISAQSFAASL